MGRYLVVDASFCIRLFLPGPQRDAFRSRLEGWLQDGYELCAPELWLYEMTTALCKGVFFGMLTPEEAERSLPLMHELGVRLIAPDPEQTRLAFGWTRRLNRAAAYESFYLALAEAMDCALWTADRHLVNAVSLPWVQLA